MIEAVRSKLLLLLHQVRAAHHTNQHTLAQFRHEVERLFCGHLARRAQRAIDIKEANAVGALRSETSARA